MLFFCHHGVLRFVRVIVKATAERNASHNDTPTHLRLFFEKGRKAKAVSSSTGLF